jgi:hypothetical protein
MEVVALKRDEHLALDINLDYLQYVYYSCKMIIYLTLCHRMDQLSNEVRQKLATVRPETLVSTYLYCIYAS